MYLCICIKKIIRQVLTLEIIDTLDHLKFHALYFSRIASELSFRALYIWRERTTREIEDNSGLCFVLICIQTP